MPQRYTYWPGGYWQERLRPWLEGYWPARDVPVGIAGAVAGGELGGRALAASVAMGEGPGRVSVAAAVGGICGPARPEAPVGGLCGRLPVGPATGGAW